MIPTKTLRVLMFCSECLYQFVSFCLFLYLLSTYKCVYIEIGIKQLSILKGFSGNSALIFNDPCYCSNIEDYHKFSKVNLM